MTDAPHDTLLNDYHLLSYDTLDSTNEEARRLAEGGGAHGAVIWSRKQTHGKGRKGRTWISDEGNLFVSFLLAPDVTLEQLPELSFVAGLAVLDTLQPIISDLGDVSLKWPNDVLFNDKKIAGILAESFETAKREGVNVRRWAVIGIGVNVEHHPAKGVLYPTTDLKTAGVEIISAKIILSRLIHHFVLRYDQWMHNGFSSIRAAWRANAHNIGEFVSVQQEDGVIEGAFLDVDAQGRMVIVDKEGEKVFVGSGDVLLNHSVETSASPV